MAKPYHPKRGYRTMGQEEIWTLGVEECKRGIKSCLVARSIARRYGDVELIEAMELQIGLFTIQLDMLHAGDINLKGETR